MKNSLLFLAILLVALCHPSLKGQNVFIPQVCGTTINTNLGASISDSVLLEEPLNDQYPIGNLDYVTIDSVYGIPPGVTVTILDSLMDYYSPTTSVNSVCSYGPGVWKHTSFVISGYILQPGTYDIYVNFTEVSEGLMTGFTTGNPYWCCDWIIHQNMLLASIIVTGIPVNAGVDKSICAGASTTIGTPSVAGYSYSWSPSNGLSSATSSQPTASPTSTTSYILSVSQNGFTSTDTVLVTVNPLPVANAGPDKTTCAGSSVLIGVSTPPNGMSYSWSPTTGVSNPNVAYPIATVSVPTQYIVTVTNTLTGCQKRDTMMVNISGNTSPITNAGLDKVLCKGTATTLGTTGQPGYTYNWYPTTGLSASTSATPTATPLVSTTYVVSVLDPNVGCIKKDTVLVTVNPLPTANAGLDKNICLGSTSTLGTTAVSGMNYAWSPSTGLSSATISNPVVSPTINTAYYLTVTNSTTGCFKKDTVNVVIKPLPIANAGVDKTICSGQTVSIGSPAITGYTYAWSPSGSLNSGTVANPVSSVLATTNYILTATLNGCIKKDTAKVTVNALPGANAGVDKTICLGTTTNLGTVSVPGMNYSWTPSTTLNNATISNPVASPSSTTNYILTVSNSTTGCTKKDTVKVTVNPVPTANAGLDKSICIGSTAALGTTAVSGMNYSWSPSTGLSSPTVSNPIASSTVSTAYYLTVTNGTTGCLKRDTVNVVIKPLPVANAGVDKTICSGQTVSIGSAAIAGYTYAWSPPGSLNSATVANPVSSVLGTTNFILTATLNGCSKKDTAKVTVNALPSGTAGVDKTVITGASTTIGAIGSAANTYTWSPTTGLNNPFVSNPSCTPLATTTYTLTIVSNATGCARTDQVLVTATSPQPRNGEKMEEVLTEASTFIVYPNPTSDKLFVQSVGEVSGETRLRLYDVLGEMIWEQNWENQKGQFETEMNLESFAKGLYFLKIQTETGNQTIRIIRE